MPKLISRDDRYIIRDLKQVTPSHKVEVIPLKNGFTYSDPKDIMRINRSKNRNKRRK